MIPVEQARGSTSTLEAFTGNQGQIVVNTDDSAIHVQDGSTAGGISIPGARRNAQSGTSYSISLADQGKVITFDNASAVAVALAAPADDFFPAQKMFTAINIGAGTVTITATGATINGGSMLELAEGAGTIIISDGTNYVAMLGSAPSAYISSVDSNFSVSSGELKFASIASGYVLANDTGSSGEPTGVSLSALIDEAFGNTQGGVLYRGASDWSLLAPGSSGQVLTTQGSAENPEWASVSGSGTVNSGTEGDVAYYAATGTAVSGSTLTALIDAAIGDTQGAILYRGASDWAILSPGTSGDVLTTQGSGENPEWAASSGGTSITNEGEWSAGDGYAVGNAVTYDGAGYLCYVEVPAPSSPAIDGTATAENDATTITLSLTTTNSNDIIYVAVNSGSATGSAPTVSSVVASGLTFTQRKGVTQSQQDLEIWTALAASPLSSESIVVTLNSTPDGALGIAFGVSGTDINFDSNASLPYSASNSKTVDTVTDEIYDLLLLVTGTVEPTTPSGYTQLSTQGHLEAVLTVSYEKVSAVQSGSLTLTAGENLVILWDAVASPSNPAPPNDPDHWVGQGMANSNNYDYQQPATGATIVAASGCPIVLVDPSAAIATLTVTMPPDPSDGQYFEIDSSQTIGTLTVNTSDSTTVNGNSIMLAANGGVRWMYKASNTTWYRRA